MESMSFGWLSIVVVFLFCVLWDRDKLEVSLVWTLDIVPILITLKLLIWILATATIIVVESLFIYLESMSVTVLLNIHERFALCSPSSSRSDGRLLVNTTQIIIAAMGFRWLLLGCQCFRHNNITILRDGASRRTRRSSSIVTKAVQRNLTGRQTSRFFNNIIIRVNNIIRR